MGRSPYCGGDSDEGCICGVVSDLWYGSETTWEETPGAREISCVSVRNMPEPEVRSVAFWECKKKMTWASKNVTQRYENTHRDPP